MEGLRSAHGYLQRRISRELRLKRTPTLDFSYDDTTDRAMRVDALIDAELEGAPLDDGRQDRRVPADEHRVESTPSDELCEERLPPDEPGGEST
jgi:hypothetical protein